MKQFTIIKTGYTAGVYGCTNEFFTVVITDDELNDTFTFKGMYGAEERVAEEFKLKGYKRFYCRANFGKLVRNDLKDVYVRTENEAIQVVRFLDTD